MTYSECYSSLGRVSSGCEWERERGDYHAKERCKLGRELTARALHLGRFRGMRLFQGLRNRNKDKDRAVMGW